MDLMNLLSNLIPFLNKKEAPEYFFALRIQEKQVEGAVWGVEGKHLRIIRTAQKKLTHPDELIDKANLVLDEALADFTPEPTKVLFGVPDGWLRDDNLLPEYLKTLRHLVKELDISPMAFVSTNHAMAHLLEYLSGAPITTILVEVADPLIVTVVKGGKIIVSKEAKRSEDLPEDIEKILETIHDLEVLPSKIVVYGEGEINQYRDKLLSFSWIPKLPFLHLPKIELMSGELTIKAVCLAGASELYSNVVFSLGRDVPQVQKKLVTGFVAGDIEQAAGELSDDESYLPREALAVTRHRGSMVEGGLPTQFAGVASGATGFLGGLFSKLTKLPGVNKLFRGGKLSGKLPLIIPGVVLLLFVLLYVLLPKASVTIFVDPKVLEKDAQVIADPTIKTVDEANKKIPGKVVEIDEQGSQKANATGKKQVGDPARGSVNVYNLTSNQVNLAAGTTLTASSGLKFTLDSSVSIASQSASVGADFTTVTTPGKSGSKVTAAAIGPDSNLPAGTNLSVGNYPQSQVVAKIDTALTGGTSKEVAVVSGDDQKSLLASLTSDLRNKATSDLQGKLTGDMKVLPEGLAETIGKPSYSKGVGDPATDFSLSLSVHYKGTAYSENDLKTIVAKLVGTTVPDGFQLDLAETQTQADVAKLDPSGQLYFNAKFMAKLMPRIDTDKIKEAIIFKSSTGVLDYLKTIDNVIGGDIQLKPNLPGPFQRLPILSKNISVEVKAK